MPNLLAHRLFIDRIIADKNFDEKEINALRLATQGPDPLFYHGIMPWRSWHFIVAIKKIGNKLHKEDGKRFFLALKEELDTIQDEEEKKVFSSFCFGQITHLLLDRTAHPFIYYFSGFDENGRLTGIYHYEHANYESEIDCLLAIDNPEIDFRGKTFLCLPYDKEVYSIIDKHLVPVLEKMYGIKLSKKYYTNSVKNFRSMQKMTTNKFLKVFGKHNMFNALYTPQKVENDVLNLKKQTWKNPVSGEEHDESFMELFSIALDKAKVALDIYLKQGFSEELINSVVDGKDYRGVEVDSKLKYCFKRK